MDWQLKYEEAVTHAGLEINNVAKTYLEVRCCLQVFAPEAGLLSIHTTAISLPISCATLSVSDASLPSDRFHLLCISMYLPCNTRRVWT